MPDYNHRDTEQKWQCFWDENQTYRVETERGDGATTRPKYYVLDMFPYPSGAGLHVGHPLGYIASDIVSRYKRLRGFNVLHPMGFDSFGLPAEQYAIQTGQHPATTTEANLTRYIEQLKNIGFSYDWSREVKTSSPDYYKWTQWIFMELFRSWYNRDTDKAEPIETLIVKFAENGTAGVNAVCDDDCESFSADDWADMTDEGQYATTLKYRLTYLADAVVNFCPALGMVLANDEVKDGVSERGGYPVVQKLMRQWMMRITAYADRLISGLDTIDWTDSLKEQQRNWIGRSVGATVRFALEEKGEKGREGERGQKGTYQESLSSPSSLSSFIDVFTTRVDTIFGVTFMVLAPEHELVESLTTPGQREAVEAYVNAAKLRSERDRMADAKTVSGVFTGSYCLNPVNNEPVPIYLADYVLAGYGTGAVMAVPSGDQRDWLFAKHFGLPIIPILDGQKDIDNQADNTKEGHYINSGFINGLTYQEATTALIAFLEQRGAGKGKVNFRLRDAVFSRQRYWGEPVPVYFKPRVDSPTADSGLLPYLIEEADLPLELPAVDKYLPTETGEPPLGRAEGWKYTPKSPTGDLLGSYDYELSTMPGWAGSSWYWYRYMDPQNQTEFASREAIDYWQSVDLYIGGTEHATGHLLYSRFWNKFMKDRGYVPHEEPFQKLINQGMIQGVSMFATVLIAGPNYEIPELRGLDSISIDENQVYWMFSPDESLVKEGSATVFFRQRIPVELVESENGRFYLTQENLDILKKLYPQYSNYKIATSEALVHINVNALGFEEGRVEVMPEVEKMSKSKFNVVNPDVMVEKYGADVLRLYEMFLGPLEQAKPWNTNGIDGVFRFIKKFWRMFYKDNAAGEPEWLVTDTAPTPAELKILHRTIKKTQDDIDGFSFNTSVSSFMICVNELAALKCHSRAVLQDLVLLLSPYAPHITEELWAALGNKPGSVSSATWPTFNPAYLIEDSFAYPIQINGKVRITMNFAADRPTNEIEAEVLADETVQKWLDGKAPKKIVVVPKRIVNVVI
jgi:leucyl-tRNA synthetase